MKKTIPALLLILVIGLTGCTTMQQSHTVKNEIAQRLAFYGHRNWIAVVDSAYPLQTAPGIDTVVAGGDQLTIVKDVLAELQQAKHVFPVALVDNELAYVAEKNAPGISAYRANLKNALAGVQVETRPHEEIIRDLDEASKLVKVLIIKTDCIMPYTSVFFRLECGYWNAQSEQELRDAISANAKQ